MSIKKKLSIKTLFGGIILNAIINVYNYLPSNLFYFFYSYLQYINDNCYSQEKIELLLILSNVIYFVFIPIGILLNFYFNITIITGISLLLKIVSLYLLFYSYTNKIFILYLITKSSCSGLSLLPILLELWKYFPNNKGLIIGIFYIGKGIIDILYEYISIKIINPKNIDIITIVNIYPEEVIENYFNYLKFLMIILCICSSICQCLIYPYSIYINYFSFKKNKFKEKMNKGLLKDFYILSSKTSYRNTIGSTNSSNDESLVKDKGNDDKNNNIEIKEPFIAYITSYPFLQLSFIYFLIMSFNSIDLSSIKKLGLNYNHGENFLLFSKIIWKFINIFWNISVGYILDLFKFKKLLLILIILQIFLISTYYLIINNKFGFIIFSSFSSIINSTNNIMVPFSFGFIFGDEIGLLLYGISSILINSFYFYRNYILDIMSEKIYFFVLCLIYTLFHMIALITLCLFEEKKHIYKTENENQEQIMFIDLSNGKELDFIDICDEKEFKKSNYQNKEKKL